MYPRHGIYAVATSAHKLPLSARVLSTFGPHKRSTTGFKRPAFGDAAYWDGRYSQAGTDAVFDWYFCHPHALQRALRRHAPGARCLEVGCGTSMLGQTLECQGFDVTYCDFSVAAIEFWRHKLGPAAASRYHVADVRALPFDEHSFAFAADKGCLDALVFGQTDESAVVAEVAVALQELERVLDTCGACVYSFSTDPPELRADLLRQAGPRWEVSAIELDNDDCASGESSSIASQPATLQRYANAMQCSYYMYILQPGAT